MRRKIKKRDKVGPDFKYGSQEVAKFINHIMQDGKKNTARSVVYDAFDVIKSGGKDPMEILDSALRNVGPAVEVRGRRIGGANYSVPREVRPDRQLFLAMKWIRDAAGKKSGKPMSARLADELVLAAGNEGEAVKKRENTQRMADANKAFAHFSW